MLKNRVCIITVYFGNIPPFFNPFLSSCGWNEEFHFLLVHDQVLPYVLPNNVSELIITINDFREKINQKLGTNINNLKPYKICDYRPAFGLLFQEHIRNYDFWGICDNDLIFGHLSDFITDELLDSFDKLFTFGHLSLIRNNNICNTLFLKETPHSRNFFMIANSERNEIFDEEKGFNEKFLDEKYSLYTEKICADGKILRKRFRLNTRLQHLIAQPGNPFWIKDEKKNYKYQVFCIDRGNVYKLFWSGFPKQQLRQESYGYIHKLEFKTQKPITKNSRIIISYEGYIENSEFFNAIDENILSKKMIKKVSPPQSVQEHFYMMYWNLRMIWRHLKHFMKDLVNYEKET